MAHPGSGLIPTLRPRRSAGLAVSALGLGLLLAGCHGRSLPSPPVVSSFQASPSTLTAGQGTFLTFAFSGGTASIDQGVGTVTSGTPVVVSPTATTTYTLTANNQGLLQGATVTVNVKTFLPKFVYTACAGASGGLYGFTLNDATGALTPVAGAAPATLTPGFHVTSDPQGRFLFVVNGDGVSAGNKLSAYQINGTTGALTPVAATPSVTTAASPYCAAVEPQGKFLYVRCEGAISAYSIDPTTGALTSLGAAIPTSGGRGDLTIHPAGNYLFTVGRTSNTLDVFGIDAATGALTRKGSAYALPAGTGPVGVTLNASGEFLYTKGEGTTGDVAVSCAIYGYRLDFITGLLTPLGSGPLVSGLLSADAYHGMFASPTRNQLYATFGNASPAMDAAGYVITPGTGSLTLDASSPYAWFPGNGSDSLVVTRNGKWAFLTNYYGSQIATATVDPLTGALTRINPTSGTVGNFPVSVTVVGTLQ